MEKKEKMESVESVEKAEKVEQAESLTLDAITAILTDNGGKQTATGVDVKIQYNKADITLIFRKGAYNKLGIDDKKQTIPSLHFENVEQGKKAIEKIEQQANVKLIIG